MKQVNLQERETVEWKGENNDRRKAGERSETCKGEQSPEKNVMCTLFEEARIYFKFQKHLYTRIFPDFSSRNKNDW